MIRLQITEDFDYKHSGGTHLNEFGAEQYYHWKKDKIITLQDLFKVNTPFLDTLSQCSRRYLTNNPYKQGNYSAAIIENATQPTLEQFDRFYFTEDGLGITFTSKDLGGIDDGVELEDVIIEYVKLKAFLVDDFWTW